MKFAEQIDGNDIVFYRNKTQQMVDGITKILLDRNINALIDTKKVFVIDFTEDYPDREWPSKQEYDKMPFRDKFCLTATIRKFCKLACDEITKNSKAHHRAQMQWSYVGDGRIGFYWIASIPKRPKRIKILDVRNVIK